jgi:hypothetical protein
MRKKKLGPLKIGVPKKNVKWSKEYNDCSTLSFYNKYKSIVVTKYFVCIIKIMSYETKVYIINVI